MIFRSWFIKILSGFVGAGLVYPDFLVHMRLSNQSNWDQLIFGRNESSIFGRNESSAAGS
jgi:hypothetical protein